MEKVTLKFFNENITNIFDGECPKIYYCVHENTEVNYGREEDCDLEYCKEHGIEAFQMKRDGGTIVCSKGNIGISAITPVKWGFQCASFTTAFVEYLKSFGLNVTTDLNDILIDGYKVASSVEIRVGKDLHAVYSTYQISINQDMEAIKHICKKEMIKVPKALKDYGFTTEQLEDWCNQYWDNLVKINK